jgi:hypothetical protein
MGAGEYQPITPHGDEGLVTAAVVDPFGSALGLAVLTSVAAARTGHLLVSGESRLAALSGGCEVAFLVAAASSAAAAALGAAFLGVGGETAGRLAEAGVRPCLLRAGPIRTTRKERRMNDGGLGRRCRPAGVTQGVGGAAGDRTPRPDDLQGDGDESHTVHVDRGHACTAIRTGGLR